MEHGDWRRVDGGLGGRAVDHQSILCLVSSRNHLETRVLTSRRRAEQQQRTGVEVTAMFAPQRTFLLVVKCEHSDDEPLSRRELRAVHMRTRSHDADVSETRVLFLRDG